MDGNKKDIMDVISTCNRETIKTCLIQDLSKKNEKTCKWEKNIMVGRGQMGEAYSVCCDKDCNYIFKRIQFKEKDNVQSFISEVKLQDSFHKKGMAPRIIVACYCNHEGVILMEKVQLVSDYLKDNPSVNRSDLKRKYVKKYRELLKSGLVHNDTNPGNVAISLDGKTPLFIDFGLSYKKELTGDEIENILKEFEMSMDFIFKGGKATVVERVKPKAVARINRYDSDDLSSSDSDESDDSLSVPRYKNSMKKSKPSKPAKKPLTLFDDDDEDDFIKKPKPTKKALSFDEL